MNSEQLRRIEENRRQALLKLQANSMANRPTPPQQHISHTPVNMPRPVQQVQQLVESTKRTVSLDLFLKSTQRFSIEPWLPDILQSGEFCRRFPADNRTFKLECFYEVVKYLQALKHPHIRLTLSLPPRSVIDHLLRRLRQTSGVQQRESHNNVSGFAFHNGRIDGNNSIDDGALRERLEPVISQSLLPYQLSGVSFAINNCDGRLLLADDMYYLRLADKSSLHTRIGVWERLYKLSQ